MSTLHARTQTTTTSPPIPARRSTAGYWVAGFVVLAGLATGFVWAVLGAVATFTASADFGRGALPGSVTVQVTHPGTVVVYYEGEPVPPRSALDLRVTDFLGRQLPLRPYDPLLQYDAPGRPSRVATAVGSFEADLTGAYTVESSYRAPAAGHLAVGEDIARAFIDRMVAPTALAACSVLLAGAVLWGTAVHRRRAA